MISNWSLIWGLFVKLNSVTNICHDELLDPDDEEESDLEEFNNELTSALLVFYCWVPCSLRMMSYRSYQMTRCRMMKSCQKR
jgi:hypothetical protein